MPEQYSFHDPNSLLAVVNDGDKVPTADSAEVWVDDPSGDMTLQPYEEAKAIYSPNTEEVFGVQSADYEIINPAEFFGPLAAELNERDRAIEGTVTVRNGGASGYAEVLLRDSGIWPVDRDGQSEPIRSGVTAQWSHDGGISVKASAFAQDGMCENTMRRVSDSIYVKHSGDVDGRVDFRDEWASVLDDLGVFSENLESVVSEAFDFEVLDLSTDLHQDMLDAAEALESLDGVAVPAFLNERDRAEINAMYELLGFPRYLALAATGRVLWRLTKKVAGEQTVSAWDAYQGATYAITHEARFESGSSTDDRYHRLAADILANPQMIETEMQREAQSRLAPAADQDTLSIAENTGDAMREYKETVDELEAALQ